MWDWRKMEGKHCWLVALSYRIVLWAPHSQDVEDLCWELLRSVAEHKIWEAVEVEYSHFH